MYHFPILIFVKYNIKIIYPNIKKRYAYFRIVSHFLILGFSKIISFQDVPIFFLILLGVPVSPKINNVVLGGLDTSQNPKIMKMRIWGFQNNEIGILLYQDEVEKINKAIKRII